MKDPDRRVQDALRVVFAKFAELQSVRQVHAWLREEGIALPTASHSTAEGRGIVWRLPLYNTVHNILTNPVYAGAYAFGRTTSKVSVEGGRKRVRRGVRRSLAEWDVLLKDQHEGYISWAEFERNQRVIANNATGKGSALARGAARQGGALSLPGCSRESRRRALHLIRRLARRSCRRHGGAAGFEATRHRCGGQGDGCPGRRDVGRQAAAGASAAAGALRGRPCAPAIRCCRSHQSSGGERARAALERGAAGRAPDRERDCRHRGEEAGALGRGGAAAADAARRRPRTRLVAPCGDTGDAQEDRACGFERNRSARRSRAYRDDPALAGRRPYCAEAEEERSRQAPLDDTRGYTVAGPRVGAADARPANRTAPQSRRQADGARQRLDPGAGVLVPQPPRHRHPPC